LQVTIDGLPWLADVGFGCSLAEPIPLAEGEYRQDPLVVGLQQVDGYWRYTERFGDAPFSYDFRLEPADETLLAEKCKWQARAAESNFVLNFTAQCRVGDRQKLLRGRVLTERKGETESQRVLADLAEFIAVLRDIFGIEHARLESVWPQVCARHEQLFGPVAA
jgi:N-hydroxyarylamine O-acetyltransferase